MSKRRSAPWVPLSVYFYDDSALMEAGEFAETMFVRMMAYAGRHRDWDGLLPRSVVLTRLGLVALKDVPESAPESRLEALLDSGLVTAHDGRIQIVGWLKWNESGSKAEESRAADRERKSAVARYDDQDAPEGAPESKANSGTSSGALSGAQDKSRREEKKKEQTALRADFDAWYAAYPKKVARPAAEKAYLKARKSTSPLALLIAAQAMAKAYASDKTYCPNPATWLNQERWNDETSASSAEVEQVGPTREAQLRYEASQQQAPDAESLPW